MSPEVRGAVPSGFLLSGGSPVDAASHWGRERGMCQAQMNDDFTAKQLANLSDEELINLVGIWHGQRGNAVVVEVLRRTGDRLTTAIDRFQKGSAEHDEVMIRQTETIKRLTWFIGSLALIQLGATLLTVLLRIG